MKKNFLLALALIVLLIIFIYSMQGPKKPSSYKENTEPKIEKVNMQNSNINNIHIQEQKNRKGKKSPDFTLKTPDGKKISLSDFKGKVIILDFWATWCPPCKMEIPGFIKLYKKYKNDGLVVLGIALDRIENVKHFIKSYGINYPVVIGNQELTIKYGGIRGIPTTFVIDKEGYIVRKYVGYRDESVFENDFLSLK